MTLTYLAWSCFILGDTENALSHVERAIESSRVESPHAAAAALSNCSYVYQCIGDIDKVYQCTDELLEHAERHGEMIYLDRGKMTRNWADCITGRDENAVDAVRDQIDRLLQSSEEIDLTYNLGVLADLQIRKGRHAEALRTLDKALLFASKNGESFYLPELYRLKAQALAVGDFKSAADDDTDYIKLARDVAKVQQAKAWLDHLANNPTGKPGA